MGKQTPAGYLQPELKSSISLKELWGLSGKASVGTNDKDSGSSKSLLPTVTVTWF